MKFNKFSYTKDTLTLLHLSFMERNNDIIINFIHLKQWLHFVKQLGSVAFFTYHQIYLNSMKNN